MRKGYRRFSNGKLQIKLLGHDEFSPHFSNGGKTFGACFRYSSRAFRKSDTRGFYYPARGRCGRIKLITFMTTMALLSAPQDKRDASRLKIHLALMAQASTKTKQKTFTELSNEKFGYLARL